MAYKITDSCVACGTCIGECPTEAISAGDIYVIDADKCIECGACAYVCPSSIRLVDYFRFSKSEIWTQEQQEKAADLARQQRLDILTALSGR